MEKIGHFNAQKQRLFGEFYVEGVIAPVISDYREVGLLLERLEGGLDTQDVLCTVGETCHEVLVAEVHIHHLRREDYMCSFLETYL